MKTWDLSNWSQGQLTILLVAAFLGIIAVVALLLLYLRKTRPRPAASSSDGGQSDSLGEHPSILLRRKSWTGRLEVEIENKTYWHLRDIEDGRARRALRLAALDLISFAGLARAEGPASAEDSTPPKTSYDEAEASPGPAHYAPARDLARQALLAQLEQENLQVEPPKNWLEVLSRNVAARRAASARDRDFVEEIEAILQRRLKEKALQAEVHLRTDGQGIARVEVDGILYDSPGAIDNLAIREVIRAAVGEWEAHH